MNTDDMGWNRTSEKVPDRYAIVLCYDEEDKEDEVDAWCVGFHDGRYWRTTDGMRMVLGPSHWSELPEAPA